MLLLVGCSADRESLDQFSHAYTVFQDAADEAEVSAGLPFYEQTDFRKAVARATSPRASNESRARYAAVAIEAYHRQMPPMLAMFAEDLRRLDTSVIALIEAANRIRNEKARPKAIEIAHEAREIHRAYSELRPLYGRRVERLVELLEDIAAKGGALTAIDVSEERAEEMTALVNDTEQKGQQLRTHRQAARDLFSALKGQFDLRTYPSKLAADSASTK